MACVQQINAGCGARESALRRALDLFALWRHRLAGRRALEAMDERSLRDIGLTRYDAHFEIRKPFWRA
jgi:uncharacterized protein YjiS (DUF1127 family)